MSLYNKYRPTSFEGMVGNYSYLSNYNKDPSHNHSLLLVGPSGCGKTVSSHILAEQFGAEPEDIHSVNCGDTTGIDDVRNILEKRFFKPWGKAHVFIFNECQQLTDAGVQALLDPTEFPESNVYYIFTSNRLDELSGKRIKSWETLKTRLYTIEFTSLDSDDLYTLLRNVSKAGGVEVDSPLLYKVSEIAEGSARKALTILEQVWKHQVAKRLDYVHTLHATEENSEVIELCRALMGVSTWNTITKVFASLKETMEPDAVRRVLLGYFSAILTKAGNPEDRIIKKAHFMLEPMYEWNVLLVAIAKAYKG